MSIRLPRSRKDWRLAARTVRLVNSSPGYAVLSAVAGFVGLNVFVLTQNLDLFFSVVVGGSLPLTSRVGVVVGLYPLVGTAFTLMESGLLVIVAVLFGVNLSMLTYQFREHGLSIREGSGSAAGMLLGVLGAGCAACGTAILAGILSLVGAAGVATLLPLEGMELLLLAFAMLVLSVYWLADGMRGGTISGCPVEL